MTKAEEMRKISDEAAAKDLEEKTANFDKNYEKVLFFIGVAASEGKICTPIDTHNFKTERSFALVNQLSTYLKLQGFFTYFRADGNYEVSW